MITVTPDGWSNGPSHYLTMVDKSLIEAISILNEMIKINPEM